MTNCMWEWLPPYFEAWFEIVHHWVTRFSSFHVDHWQYHSLPICSNRCTGLISIVNHFFVLVPDVVCIYDTEWPQTLAEHKSLLQKSHVFACLWLWSYESHDLKQCVIYSPTATTSSTGSSLAVSHQSVLLQSVLGLVFYCYMDHVRKWLTTSYQLVVSAYISYNLFTEWIMGLQPRSFGSRGKCFTTGLPVIC